MKACLLECLHALCFIITDCTHFLLSLCGLHAVLFISGILECLEQECAVAAEHAAASISSSMCIDAILSQDTEQHQQTGDNDNTADTNTNLAAYKHDAELLQQVRKRSDAASWNHSSTHQQSK